MRLSIGLTLLFLSIPSAIVGTAACSSSAPDKAPVAATDGGGDAAQPTSECAAKTTFLECRVCCGLADPEVADAFGKSQVAFIECLCMGPCKDICATTGCSLDPDAGETTAECQACLDSETNGQTCVPQAQAACNKDPKCSSFRDCSLAADCNAKPD